MKQQIQQYNRIRELYSDAEKTVIESEKFDKEKAFGIGIVVFTSDEVNKSLLHTVELLKQEDPDQLYIQDDYFHITLQQISVLPAYFDNSIYDNHIDRVNSTISKIKPFTITYRGLNNFPNVIFAQVFSRDNNLYSFQKKLAEAIPGQDSQLAFIPHVSVVRFTRKPTRLLKVIPRFGNADFGDQTVDSIALVKCRLPFRGEHYEIMRTFNLGSEN